MTNPFREISRLPQFERDLKNLSKRFRTLPEDLNMLIATELFLYHKLEKDNRGIFPIPGLATGGPAVFKVKKFACRSLKGKGVQSGLRLIYARHPAEDKVELIEIYYKGDKPNEDRERINDYLARFRSSK